MPPSPGLIFLLEDNPARLARMLALLRSAFPDPASTHDWVDSDWAELLAKLTSRHWIG